VYLDELQGPLWQNPGVEVGGPGPGHSRYSLHTGGSSTGEHVKEWEIGAYPVGRFCGMAEP
jgi:hypothetical protein